MRQAGETSSGNVIIEMTSLEWEKLEAGISVETGSLEWHIKKARDQGKLEPQVAAFIIRACMPGGTLTRTTFEDFPAMVRNGGIRQVPYIGPDRARILHEAFVDEE